MRITYDAEADAAYIYLTDLIDAPDTRDADTDIYLDFDSGDRLVGIEVLDASKRLDLHYLAPLLYKLDEMGLRWHQLHRELLKRKREGMPVESSTTHAKNWIEEVGEDHVVVRSERTGNSRKITRHEVEDRDVEKHVGKQRIILALRVIGGYT